MVFAFMADCLLRLMTVNRGSVDDEPAGDRSSRDGAGDMPGYDQAGLPAVK
jgi:hypothetical protein